MSGHGSSGVQGRPTRLGGGAGLDGRLDELIAGSVRTPVQQLVLAHDWAGTALGDESTWSHTLRTAVSTVLNSGFGMVLFCGPELVQVYNDAYVPMLGDRHPWALGARAPEVWADVWADVEDLVTDVFSGGVSYREDLPLVMTRYGFPEETYFTFSYSPVVEPGGRVIGLLNTVVETTPRVLAARRMTVLQRLGALQRSVHGTAEAACRAALDVLADARSDLPFALAYLVGDGRVEHLVTGPGIPAEARPTASVLPGEVRQVVTTGAATTVTGLTDLLPGLTCTGAGPAEEFHVRTAVVLPLVVAGRVCPVGALVLGTSPRLRLDDEYRVFLQLAAGQVAAAIADAQAVLTERRQAEQRAELERARGQFFTEVAVTLQRAVLGPTALPEGFAVHYEPAAGTLEVGGDWYDVVDLPDGRYGVVVGDVVGRGLAAAAVMGQLRSAGRALLLESNSPAAVLEALDRFAELVPGATCSTVFCAVVDTGAATLRYSSAGHPPAILVDDQGRSWMLEAARGLPLAAQTGRDRPEAAISLPPGSTLLLYTDGLIERRDEALDEGIDRATKALIRGRHLATAALAQLLTDQLLADAPDDDVAFLIYRG